MTGDHGPFTHSLEAWLDTEDDFLDSDAVLGRAMEQVETKPQRRADSWPDWRSAVMNKTLSFVAAAAAVVVIAAIGFGALGGFGGSGFGGSDPSDAGPTPTAEPSASDPPPPEAAETPEPYATVGVTFPGAGPLEPGTRYTASVDGSVPITFAVPAPGWRSDPPGWVYHGDAVAGPPGDALMWFSSEGGPQSIFTDACAHTGMQEFEGSAAGRVEEMTSLHGAEVVSGPSPITIDGRTGQFVAVVIPEDVGCDNSEYWIGYSADGSISYYPAYLGGTILTWAVDLDDGQVYVLEVHTRPGVSADFLDEIEQIAQSIQFE